MKEVWIYGKNEYHMAFTFGGKLFGYFYTHGVENRRNSIVFLLGY